jgi:hypothetical protein
LNVIFLTVKKSNEKNPPVSRYFLRVATMVGACENLRCSDNPPAYSVRRVDAQRGTNGNEPAV